MATISDLHKGLVGHWSMDDRDVDNGIIRDRSAFDNHGTLNGGIVTGVSSPVGRGFEFTSGNGDYLVGVRKNDETWEYDDNRSFHEFSPRPTDHLIAEVGWGVSFVNGLNIYS